MADIFDEVEEGIRQDKWTDRWKKYGIFAYLGAALLIGGVALNEYLGHTGAEALETRSGELEAALDQLDSGKYVEAADALTALSETADRISPAAAQFLAQVRLEGNGDVAAAAQVLAEAADNADGAMAKLALIKAAYLQADTLTLPELRAKLGDLTTESSAFGALALELVAAKAFAEGDLETARSEYNLIRVSANVPAGVEQRTMRALAALPPPILVDPEVASPLTETENLPEESIIVEDQADEN